MGELKSVSSSEPPVSMRTRSFSEALDLLKQGAKMSRLGWNGKDMWVALQSPDSGSKMTLPYLYMRTAAGDFIPWVVSHSDLLAGDWIVVC